MTRASWWTHLPDPDRVSGRHTVELKVLLTDDSRPTVRRAARRSLPGRYVHYFDTPGLDLAHRGVVLRLRTVGDDRCDVTVKIRRPDPVPVPDELRGDRGLTVEIDTLPDRRHWSAALNREVPAKTARQVLRGRRSPEVLFTRSQLLLCRAYAPDGTDLSALHRIGPIRIRRWRLGTLDRGSRVVAETCRYPDGSLLTEVSAKCAVARAGRVAADFTALLRGLGVDTAEHQRTKTGAALEMLA